MRRVGGAPRRDGVSGTVIANLLVALASLLPGLLTIKRKSARQIPASQTESVKFVVDNKH